MHFPFFAFCKYILHSNRPSTCIPIISRAGQLIHTEGVGGPGGRLFFNPKNNILGEGDVQSGLDHLRKEKKKHAKIY
jgi:hypothetical protein